MSPYSSIDRRINADQWFRGLSHDAQLVWLRLLTGPHVTPVAGLWAATEDGLSRAFGFSVKQFGELFAELSAEPAGNGLPRAVADWTAGVLWLPNAIKQECNQPANWRTLAGWGKHLAMIPECDIRARGLRQFAEWIDANRSRFNAVKGQGNPAVDRIVNGLRNGYVEGQAYSVTRAHVPDQEPEQEQDPDLLSEHFRLRQHYGSEFQIRKGVPHKLAPGQGGRYARAAADLLAGFGFEEAKTIVSRALADEWQRSNAPELWAIAKAANKFRGNPPPAKARAVSTPGANVERLRARAERLEAEERQQQEAANATK
jgi:hypothetical protein